MVGLGNCFTHCINDSLQPFEQRPLEFCSIFYLLGARGEVKFYSILRLLFTTHTGHVQVREDFTLWYHWPFLFVYILFYFVKN